MRRERVTPPEQLKAIRDRVLPMVEEQVKCLHDGVLPELAKNGVEIVGLERALELLKRVDLQFVKECK